jgi:peptidylprolyl isomerase
MAGIKDGDTVRINYTAKLEDGEVVDSSEGKEPLEFVAGSDQLIPGVSNAVIGMEMGESKTVTVPPEMGYGPHHPEAVQQAPREHFPPDVKIGDTFKAVAGEQEMMVRVTSLGEETVEVDANHPLAGQTLVFEMEVVE